MAGRPKNEKPTKKVEPRLPPKVFAQLQRLVEIGTYGSNPTEVSKYLIRRVEAARLSYARS
jgi:Arc/MetJ-type ribon-helix-helix transcriptional regulator